MQHGKDTAPNMTQSAKTAITAINRRLLIKTSLLGLGALTASGASAGIDTLLAAKGFTHNVASGEPTANSVLLWTRFVGGDGGTKLRAEMSEDASFKRIISGADITATPARDHIAKVVLKGLKPAHRYHYRFVAPDGSISPVGRTRTLPLGKTTAFNLAVFSCSNLPFGWFNAYAHAAERDDIDLAVFLGDYLYEYKPGNYPSFKEALPERVLAPVNEIVALADYRLRYATYRADADLQKLHQMFPSIAMWDDHEFANDSWKGGAQNHQANEGDWGLRKAAAEQAWREWMPVHDNVADTRWSRYAIGDLAMIHMTESRIGARSKQLSYTDVGGDGDALAKHFAEFRDGPWQDSARTMLGAPQEKWLGDGFIANKTPWNIWAQQTIIGAVQQPSAVTNWMSPLSPDYIKKEVARGAAAAKAGLPAELDNWDGYPAARHRALSAAHSANADLIVLSGDSHNAWAFDLPSGGKPAGVELGGQSVTSPGFESYFQSIAPKDVAAALTGTNAQLKWTDTSQRGYMTVQVTPQKVTGNWHFMATIRNKSTTLSGTHQMVALRGKRVFES
jgi:alkaline phosphatase D